MLWGRHSMEDIIICYIGDGGCFGIEGLFSRQWVPPLSGVCEFESERSLSTIEFTQREEESPRYIIKYTKLFP